MRKEVRVVQHQAVWKWQTSFWMMINLMQFLVNWQHAGFLENGAWKLECISYWQWGYASQLCYFTRGYDPPGGWWTFFACSDSQKIDGKEKSWNWRSVQESNAIFWMSNKIWSDMEIYFDYNFAFEKRWKALVILHVYHVCWSFFLSPTVDGRNPAPPWM